MSSGISQNAPEWNGEYLPTYEEAVNDVFAAVQLADIDIHEEGIESLRQAETVTAELGGGEEASHTKIKKSKKKKKSKRVFLLICDPQCDFLSSGSMSIPGSSADATRLSNMIRDHVEDIAEIYVSLNSRHKTHITNPNCWRDDFGKKPPPMTVITQTDILLGKYRSRLPDHQERYLEYVTSLELSGKEDMILWPDHCLIGTEGHAVIPVVNDALQEWAGVNMRTIDYITKGSNCFTEMYVSTPLFILLFFLF
jgi:nicotinamidase-related amidase